MWRLSLRDCFEENLTASLQAIPHIFFIMVLLLSWESVIAMINWQSDFPNHSYDYRSNWSRVSPILEQRKLVSAQMSIMVTTIQDCSHGKNIRNTLGYHLVCRVFALTAFSLRL